MLYWTIHLFEIAIVSLIAAGLCALVIATIGALIGWAISPRKPRPVFQRAYYISLALFFVFNVVSMIAHRQ